MSKIKTAWFCSNCGATAAGGRCLICGKIKEIIMND
jgi:rubrerythrin